MSDETLIAVEQVYPPREGHLWSSPDFAYSYRCILCFHNVEHGHEQHLILSRGIEMPK